ncbi:hypothetical protein L1987_59161 [Smallanthus sonchifolius]|uniref:Uncharacterized protein n=1 Tax=Smallanthus sonchifolius TaxID=185202 RepID=A0ACB9D4G8_9ASTR|nr:hypothetical protein L1987_59161 [Smallanthus sonchifolius]
MRGNLNLNLNLGIIIKTDFEQLDQNAFFSVSYCNLILLRRVFGSSVSWYYLSLHIGWWTENDHWCFTKENSNCEKSWEK